MPIYDYRCRACGLTSELKVSYSGECRSFACPGCGSSDLEKQMSTPSIITGCNPGGLTCCGAEERCETSPCSGGQCHNH